MARDVDLINSVAELAAGEYGATKRNYACAARMLGVSPQTLNNWRQRGLPDDGHLRVWLALHPKGRALLARWLAERERKAAA